ncbi:glycosyltransferase family 39 protein [Haladaptatus pallidirubidus]|uniref:glycosyltransferase family 39 protein n=1 Tax=Haladaptatus pallidirubidus TaxID=1008152 RepID=UPI001D11B6A5|nr:glycosyltransferase family 39 protein [Haladaptatus pallidirubidus]
MDGKRNLADQSQDETQRPRLEQTVASLAQVFTNERIWIVLAVLTATLIVGIYSRTHQYPAYGAGLFLSIAEEILARGYRLPVQIPGYTANGIPFAYPPLGFYLSAVFLDLGVDPITLSRVFPGFITILTVISFYYLAREITGSVSQAGVSAIIFAVTPTLLEWHISAGGIVRALAFLFTVTGLYCGMQLFKYSQRQWLAPAFLLFGFTLLTHPSYAVFFGASYLLMWIFFDHSFKGLAMGALVAISGFVIISPWLAYTISVHGIETYMAAASTHGGLGKPYSFFEILSLLGKPIAAGNTMSFWYLLTLLGSGYLVACRRFFLPVWFLSSLLLLGDPRFAFVSGTIVMGLWITVPVDTVTDSDSQQVVQWSLRVAVASVLVFSVILGGTYVAGTPFHGGTSQPAFIDDEDVTAMKWVNEEVPINANFVVLGDAAEWFPYLTDRTMLIGPWGAEWKSSAAYLHHLRTYRQLSRCHTETCLTKQLHQSSIQPDYVYIPKGNYTVRGAPKRQQPQMRRSLVQSNTYRLVYENRGVMVFRVR